MSVYSAVTKFSAVDKYSPILGKMGAATKKFAVSSSSSFRKVEDSANRLNKRLSGIGGQFKTLFTAVSIAAVLTTGANAIIEYDKATASLKAITGATADQMVIFESEVLSVAKATKRSAIDIAKGFELVGSAKPELLANAEALGEVTKQAVLLGQAGKLGIEDSVGALTISLNQFGEGAEKAAMFTDILATAQQKGSAPINYLAQAMVKAGGTSKAFGNSFADTVAVLEGFGKAGIPAAEAGTQLAGILSKLSTAQNKNFNPQFTKATDIINNLSKANLSYNDLLEMTDSQGAKWLTTIINQNGVVQKLAGNLNEVGNAQSQAAINTSTLSDKFSQLTSAYKNAIIANSKNSVGLNLFNKILDLLINNMGTIINLIAGTLAVLLPMIVAYKTIALATGIFNAALAINAILTGAGAIALKGNIIALKAYGVITKTATALQWAWNAAMTANPIGLIAAAIILAIASIVLLVKHWDTLKSKFEDSPTWMKIALLPLLAASFPLLILADTIKRFSDNWDGLRDAFSKGGMIDGLRKIGGILISVILDPLVLIFNLLSKLPKIGGGFAIATDQIKQIQASAEGGFGVDSKLSEPINTQKTQSETQKTLIKEQQQNVNININDPQERTSVDKGNGAVPILINNAGF